MLAAGDEDPLLLCFEARFSGIVFTTAHDPQRDTYQSTLRMLHYYATEQSQQGMWRAGAHTDFDCLTLLFQRPGGAACRFVPVKTAKASSGPALSRARR